MYQRFKKKYKIHRIENYTLVVWRGLLRTSTEAWNISGGFQNAGSKRSCKNRTFTWGFRHLCPTLEALGLTPSSESWLPLPANAAMMTQMTGSYHHLGRMSFQLWPGPSQTGIWGMIQWLKELQLCFCLPLFLLSVTTSASYPSCLSNEFVYEVQQWFSKSAPAASMTRYCGLKALSAVHVTGNLHNVMILVFESGSFER